MLLVEKAENGAVCNGKKGLRLIAVEVKTNAVRNAIYF